MTPPKRRLIVTNDGSHTVFIPELHVTFHSRHGAIQESKHVFIDAGFRYAALHFARGPLNILEVGFGTGLNAFMTAIASKESQQSVRYVGLETNPLDMATTAALNYPEQLGNVDLFDSIQLAPWNALASVHDTFSIQKQATNLLEYEPAERYHLVYFDAFDPEVQPQLWTEPVFRRLAEKMFEGGILVTYCSKGIVRRAMQAAGWTVEKLEGPKGKREMVRAVIRNRSI